HALADIEALLKLRRTDAPALAGIMTGGATPVVGSQLLEKRIPEINRPQCKRPKNAAGIAEWHQVRKTKPRESTQRKSRQQQSANNQQNPVSTHCNLLLRVLTSAWAHRYRQVHALGKIAEIVPGGGSNTLAHETRKSRRFTNCADGFSAQSLAHENSPRAGQQHGIEGRSNQTG